MQLLKVNLFVFITGLLVGWGLGGFFLGISIGALLCAIVLIWYTLATELLLQRLNAITLTEASAASTMYRLFLSDAYKLIAAAGFPRTSFSIIQNDVPLAFSLGSRRSGGRIIVTSGLFKTLSRAEISAVVAHELGHIRAGEREITAMWLGLSLVLASVWTALSSQSRKDHLPATLTSVTHQVSPGRLKPDCRADAFAATLCKDSSIMASALHKLERGVRATHWDVLDRTPTLRQLAIVNPIHARLSYERPEQSPMAHRVAELRRLALPNAA